MEGSRKRKHSDGTVASPSRDQESAAGAANDLQRLSDGDLLKRLRRDLLDERHGHTYTGAGVRDNARAHIGDSITAHNHGPQSRSEAAKEERFDKFMEASAFERMDFRRAAIDPAHAETCGWILEHDKYMRWQE